MSYIKRVRKAREVDLGAIHDAASRPFLLPRGRLAHSLNHQLLLLLLLLLFCYCYWGSMGDVLMNYSVLFPPVIHEYINTCY
jgi:hypothetical protein